MAADATDTGAAGAKDDDPSRDGGAATTTSDASRDGSDADLSEGAKKVLDTARKAERAAARRAAEAEAKVKEFEDRDKTQQQKDAEEKAKAHKEATDARTESLRLRVAIEKQLPAQLIDRLRGTTREELEADAAELLKLVDPAASGGFGGGARRPATNDNDMDALIRRAAGRT